MLYVAKASILKVKGHGGYSSCTKYTIEGISLENRVCFPSEKRCRLRTHEMFLSQEDEEYHKGTSILTTIPGFNMVGGVPIDYMHLYLSGIVPAWPGSQTCRLDHLAIEAAISTTVYYRQSSVVVDCFSFSRLRQPVYMSVVFRNFRNFI